MSPFDRRERILEILSVRNHDTYDNLAAELGVSKSTIRRDIDELSCKYPIQTVCGRYGGVRTIGPLRPYSGRLSKRQTDLLTKLSPQLVGEDLETMESILAQFGHYIG